MRKIIILTSLVVFSLNALGQTKVYFDFVTHNEETNQWNGTPYYTANRTKLITLSNYFKAKGITWNMQSDWVYLTNVLTQETTTLKSLTNNKNILVWMQQEQGVEMDPHAHESKYIYPDVVKLMDSIGLPESKLMGGTLYSQANGINLWTNLVNGQNGKMFPSKFWRPDYMMGGGTPNHVADIKYYGFWNPQSPSNYLTHDPSSRLRHFGVGCEIKIKDTSAVKNVIADIRTLLKNIEAGKYPSDGFYLQTIFFEQGDLNNMAFYNKVTEVADSVNKMVAGGKAQWKTLKQAYTEWETTYKAKMFQWECGNTTASSEEFLYDSQITIYPNPANSQLNIYVKKGLYNVGIKLYDLTGRIIIEKTNLSGDKFSLDILEQKPGMYILEIKNEEKIYRSKFMKN